MKSIRHTAFAQFFLLGMRGVLREKSVLFWSFLFPLAVTAIFLQAFSPSGRPEPLRLGVAGFAPAEMRWMEAFDRGEGVAIVPVDELLSRAPDYEEILARGGGPDDLPVALRETFFGARIDGLLTPKGFFSLKPPDAAARDANRILAAKARARGETLEIKPVRVNGLSFVDWFAPGMIGLTVLTGGLFGTSFRLTSDREKGLFRRFMLTPFRRSDYVLGFVASRGVFVVAQAVLLALLFRLLFGFTVHGSFALFVGLVVAGSLASNLLGAAIASRIRRSEVAGGVGNVIFFPMMFLSGVYFRTESFPPWLKSITDWFSLSALNSALRKVANEGLGVGAIGFEIGVLAAWCGACLAFTVAYFDWGAEG